MPPSRMETEFPVWVNELPEIDATDRAFVKIGLFGMAAERLHRVLPVCVSVLPGVGVTEQIVDVVKGSADTNAGRRNAKGRRQERKNMAEFHCIAAYFSSV
jgi:hypothetical protein